MGTPDEVNLHEQSTNVNKETENARTTFPFGARHIQAIILFLTVFTCLIMRAQLSVTLVAMTDVRTLTNNSTVKTYLNESIGSETHNERNESYTEPDRRGEWSVFRTYNWTKSTQDMIGGIFFAGYSVMNIPMGVMAQRFGGKKPVLVALFVNSAVCIIFPWAPIVGGWLATCICRLLQGMTQAALYPGVHTILGKWVPLSERGRLSTYVYTGTQLGTVVAFQLGGFLSGSPMFGWPVMYWMSGCLGFSCFALLFFFGASTPAEHPKITEAEKEFIMGDMNEQQFKAKRKTPWRSILTSIPVWAAIVSHAGSAFSFIICLIEIPVYMSKILHVDIKNNGLLSSLPYISMYLCGLGFGHICDFLVNRKYMRLINVRRLANTIGMAVSGLLLLTFAYAKTVPLAVTFLMLSFGAHSGVHVGFHINQIDLAPNFAGTLMSLGNMIASLVGVIAPTVVAIVVKDATNQSQWQTVFLITASIMFITNIAFVTLLKTDVQPWNNLDDSVAESSQDCMYEKIDKVIYATPDSEYWKIKNEEKSKV